MPYSRYESVDREKLGRYIAASLRHKAIKVKTHESVQGDPEYTSLLEKDLCCAILPFRDGPVASPPEIKDTTHC